MLSEGLIPLIECGDMNCCPPLFPGGRALPSLLGFQFVYDWLDVFIWGVLLVSQPLMELIAWSWVANCLLCPEACLSFTTRAFANENHLAQKK
jgi:hypothetical protein